MAAKGRHFQKVEAHARQTLVPAHDQHAGPAELIPLYRTFLKKEEHRIRLEHRAGAGGTAICAHRATLLDIVLQNLFGSALRQTAPRARISLLACGGYGRGLLNPGSDVDLVFLHPERRGRDLPQQTRDVIEKVLYMLWDVGFRVGHAVRSLKDTYRHALADHQSCCALLESRFITGDRQIFDDFEDNFRRQCLAGREREFLEARMKDLRERHARHGQTVHLQEPNIKNGCGGLRDCHNMLWVCAVKLGVRDLEDLLSRGILSRIAAQEVRKAHDFLLRVRNDMHYSEKRATDQLTLRLQGVVATNLGYPGRRIVQRCEAFMRDYYHHARNLYQHNLSLMERFELEQGEERPGIVSFLTLRSRARESFDGFYSWNGFIFPERPDIFEEDSARMMRLFQHAQVRRLKLSPQIRQLFKENYGRIGRVFRYRKSNRETFIAILSRKGEVGATVRQMHRVGFLARYLPEFAGLTDLVQHEFFHRYTADEHTLQCLEKLDELSDTRDPKLAFPQALFHELEDPFSLYLALIMHDTGRSENVRRHAYASTVLTDKVARRLQLSDKRRGLLLFLVDNHLLLWHTATTRNLDDPEVIASFARIVKNREWLDALFLHTYADSRATSEAGWTDWKASLMTHLYRSTQAWFEDGEGFQARARRPLAELREAVADGLDAGYGPEIDAHFSGMPERYFRFREPEDIALHIRLFRQFFRQIRKEDRRSFLTPVMRWIAHSEQGSSEVIVCTWDRHLLLAKLAGAFASQGINILSADIFLRADNLVLDIFRVCTTDFAPVTSEEVIAGVEDLVARSFDDEAVDFDWLIRARAGDDPEPLPGWRREFPARVWIDNDQSAYYTMIEIQSVDRIGLLHGIFQTIGSLGLEITHARVNTEKGAAIDSFCVTDSVGRKVRDAATLRRLREGLERIILHPD